MKEEFDLSKRKYLGEYFSEKDVREFIKRLKEELHKNALYSYTAKEEVEKFIDKLAGKDLI